MNAEMINAIATLAGAKPQADTKDKYLINGIHIVAADRGFVWVGDVERAGDCLLIHNAKNIRRWGTTKGVGELASGPTKETVADEQGEVIVPWHAVIHITKCKPNSW